MIAGVLQPGYLPWMGFFEQLDHSDVFVLYDDVQYDKNGWRNRNRIKGPNGAQWLTVPVHASFSSGDLVADARIDNGQPWARKHVRTLRQNYARAAHLGDYMPALEEVLSREWDLLVDLDEVLVRLLAEMLGLDDTPIIRSSTLGVRGDRIERLAMICRELGADTFYEGAAGAGYIDAEAFSQWDIGVEFQDYLHPQYTQLHGDFVPYLSVVDLLLNCGNASLEILREGVTGRGEDG